MKALLIRSPYIEEILAGKKTWEIRGSATKHRGKIALVRSGSGLVVGTADLVECLGPLRRADFLANLRKHRDSKSEVMKGSGYDRPHALVLKNAKELRRPIPYKHPYGAIIWVDLAKLGIKIR